MCGRFAINLNVDEVIQAFHVENVINEFKPNYNVAPTQNVPVILQADDKIALDSFRWGLIPHWAKDKNISYKLINARAETLAEKPSFKKAFAERRCIIPASGFYEWKKTGEKKQPYFIHPKRGFFAFAGLWEQWQDIKSCTIVTTSANPDVAKLHDRMPVILEEYNDWLNPEVKDTYVLSKLLKPYPTTEMYPVSDIVNSVKNNKPECLLKQSQKTLPSS